MSRQIKRLKSEETKKEEIFNDKGIVEDEDAPILQRQSLVASTHGHGSKELHGATPTLAPNTRGASEDHSGDAVVMDCPASMDVENEDSDRTEELCERHTDMFPERVENADVMESSGYLNSDLENACHLLEGGKVEEATGVLRGVYEKVADCGNKKERQQIYNRLLSIFSKCGDAIYSLLCHYQMMLLNDNQQSWEIQRLFSAVFWLDAISATSENIYELLQTMGTIRSMAERHWEEFPHRHIVVLSIMMDLALTYKCFLNDVSLFTVAKYIEGEFRKVQATLPKLFFLSERHAVVCDVLRNISKVQDMRSTELLEIWARSLHKIGKIDVAMKKLEEALQILQLNESEDCTRIHQYLKDLQVEQDLCDRGSDKVVQSDDEWLEDSTIHAVKRCQELREAREREHSPSRKKTHRRPKRQRNDSYSLPFITHNTEKKCRKEEPVITSWKDVLDNPDYSNTGRHGKKRKRRTTGASDVSTTSAITAEAPSDIFGQERGEEIISDEEANYSESEDFGQRPDDLPDYDDWSCTDSTPISDEFIDEEMDEDDEMTLYEMSISALQSGAHRRLIGIQESKLLNSGLTLSESCKRKFCTQMKKEKRFVYEDEYPRDKLLALRQKHRDRFKVCKLQIESSHGAVCTNVNVNDPIQKIEISGRSKCGKAYSDDVVVVEVYKENVPKDSVIPRLNVNLNKASKNTVYGQVRGVLERKRCKNVDHPVFVCQLDDFQNYLMKPLCKTVPKISIQRRHCENDFQVDVYEYDEDSQNLRHKETMDLDMNMKKAYVFLVAMIDWEEQYPSGVVLKVVKASESKMSSSDILRLQFQAPFLYSEPTIESVSSIMNEMPIEPTQRLTKDRVDLTDKLAVFTIDPEGSKDLDDALSIQKIDDELYEIGVHIADVTSIIKKNDPVDKEAFDRATTFYQGQGSRAYHMLPEPLSNNLCSLIPGKKRLTLSVFFKMGKDGKLKDKPSIQKTIVMSRRKYSYRDVQSIIEGGQKEDEFAEDILTLASVTKEMRVVRLGDKRFAFPVEADLSDDLDSVLDTADAHSLVEELMVLANTTIANIITRTSKELASALIIRCQAEPSQEQIEGWMKNHPYIADFVMHLQQLPVQTQQRRLSVKSESLKIRYRNIMPLQKWVWREMVEALDTGNYEKVKRLVGADGLHPEIAVAYEEWISLMENAEYRCLGCLDNPKKQGKHFSLNIFPYTHFTSPIRRYADILVHRMVHAFLNKQQAPYSSSEMNDICEHLNRVTKRAKQFQKQTKVLSWGLKLKDNPTVVHGIVQKVSDKEVTLFVPGHRGLPRSCRELSLNMLNVSTKPMFLKDQDNGKDILTLQWQRRIYSATGFYMRPRFQRLKKLEIIRIDPHQRAVFQQLLKWRNITTEIVDGKPKRLQRAFRNADTPDVDMVGNVKACHNTELDVSSEVPKGNIVRQKCNYSMSFNHAQIIAVQLSAEPERGILVPTIQLLDMTRNVKCCIQHVQNPVKIFTRNSVISTKDSYSSTVDYIRTWLPLMSMEAATNAAQNDAAVINDLYVQFENRGGFFSLRKSYCERRDIDLRTGYLENILLGKIKGENNEDQEAIEYVTSSDYLCIRCEVSKYGEPLKDRSMDKAPSQRKFWIGHARIDKIKWLKKKGKINVHFELTKDSLSPYPAMLETGSGVECCVEILQKTDDDRRTETILKFLDTSSPLAKAIALRKKIPKLDPRHVELANKFGDNIDVGGLSSNNEGQKKALKNSLRNSFSLIQGPPGTGKTRTAINLLQLFCKINRSIHENGGEFKQILFCGPSNKSVDLAAKWMLRNLGESAPSCVRMYGSNLENVDFPIPGKVFASAHQGDLRPDPELREVSLHHIIRKRGGPFAEKIREFEKMFEDDAESVDFRNIKEYCRILREASRTELKKYEVIFCTTTSAVSPRLLVPCRGKIFQLIMDEAGMCTEPQSMAAIIATKAQQVVLIGDHQQLRPVVKVNQSKILGMEKSLFERYSQRASFLKFQYRMNPAICDFPSKQFYNNRLETVESPSWQVVEPLKMWINPEKPHIFCHIVGSEECLTVSTEEGNQQSRSNRVEIEQVMKVVRHMVKEEGVQQDQINVISQYNAQCHGIRESLKKDKFTSVKVNTVVASQGGEWDYVVFSTVRSLPEYRIEPYPTQGWCLQNLGFITDKHQINVALTRARKGLIIIGNKNLLECEKDVWKDLITYYGKNHCLVEAEDFPRKQPKKHRKQKLMQQTSEEFYSNIDSE